MREIELIFVGQSPSCTSYTLKFKGEENTEFKKFIEKFRSDGVYNADYRKIIRSIEQIMLNGALERYFRREGKRKDSVVALPILGGKLRLYCLRLSEHIIILGNGGIKSTRTYQEDETLAGYVLTLQDFEQALKEARMSGEVEIDKREIKTDITFEI